MARRGSGKRGQRVATPTVAALAGLPAGVELLSAIAELDLSSLTGFDLPLLLRAVYRLGNHTRALLLDVVAEVMRRRDPDGNGTGGWDAVAVHEVRAALTMSRTAANSLNHLAQDLYERLPQVLDAMRDGRLDQPRARVFSSWTGWLSDAHARAIVDALLPIAPKLTTGELIDEIRRVAIELDPDFARRQHDHGRSQRRVHGAIGRDGTGHITAEGLSAEQIAAACDRLDAIGWYLKRAGHPDKLDHIRTDVFAGLLTGQFAGLTDEQLLEKLLTNMPAAPTPDSPFTSDTQPSGQGDLGEHAAADGRDDDAPGSARDGAPGELGAIDGDGGRMRDLSIEDPTRAAGNEMPDDNPFDDSPGNERPEEEPPEEAPEDQPPEEEPPEAEPPEEEPPGEEPPGEEPPGEEPPEGDRGGGPGVGPTGGGPAGPGGGSATPAERDSTMDAAGRGPGAPRGTPHSGTPPGAGARPARRQGR